MKRGFTLMELLVYMAILGIIVLIAGEAFSNSTKFRVRTQNMLKASQEAENVGTLFKEDAAQLGAKASLDAASYGLYPRVYMDPTNVDDDKKDSSSYAISAIDAAHDMLSFKSVRYTDAGAYEAVDSIVWKTEGKTLYRSCKTLEGTASSSCPNDKLLSVEMATGVDTFKVMAATPGATTAAAVIFPAPAVPPATENKEFKLIPRFGEGDFLFLTVTPAEGGTSVALTGFATNYDFENGTPQLDQRKGNQVFVGEKNSTTGVWSAQCSKFSLQPDVEYELSFSMPFASEDVSRMFVPGRDHMSVGFRKVADGKRPAQVDDFLFFPPTMGGASAGKRTMRFSVKEAINDVCIAFTFSSYSPVAASGKIQFNDIVFKKVETSNYRFVASTIAVTEKKNVKAFRLRMSVSRGAHDGGRGETGDVSLIVPAPSNGPRD